MSAAGVSDLGKLAAFLECPEGTVRNWHKRGSVPMSWVHSISLKTGVPMAHFLGDDSARSDPIRLPVPAFSAGESEVTRAAAPEVCVTVAQAQEQVPRWKVDREPQAPLAAGSGGSTSPKWTRAGLLRDRGAGAVQPLLLSLPFGAGEGPSGEYELIPMHVRPASAGVGTVTKKDEPDLLNLAGQMAFSFEWLRRNLGHTTGQLTTIEVRGDSMATTLLDGDTIMIDEGVDAIDVDGIYVLDLYGRRLVKRVQHLFDGTLVLISDNPCYQRENIPRDRARDVQVVGRMVWPRV